MQIVVQARSEEEAEAFSGVIDFEKWQAISSEYETVDVAKDYFERKQLVEQGTKGSPSSERPTLKLVKFE
jgi:hypothetical protein